MENIIRNAFMSLEEFLDGKIDSKINIEDKEPLKDENSVEGEDTGILMDLFEKEGAYVLTYPVDIEGKEYRLFVEGLGGSGAESCDVIYDTFDTANITGVLVELLDDDYEFIDSLANYSEEDFTPDTPIAKVVKVAKKLVLGDEFIEDEVETEEPVEEPAAEETVEIEPIETKEESLKEEAPVEEEPVDKTADDVAVEEVDTEQLKSFCKIARDEGRDLEWVIAHNTTIPEETVRAVWGSMDESCRGKTEESLEESDNTKGNMKFGDRKTPKKHLVKEAVEEEHSFTLTDAQKQNVLDVIFVEEDAHKEYETKMDKEWIITDDKSKDDVRSESDDAAFPFVLLVDGKCADALSKDYVEELKGITEALTESKKFNLRDAEEVEEAKEIIDNNENGEPIEQIVDVNAETLDDLKKSYIGNVILQCETCKTMVYKAPEDLVKAEGDDDIYNVEDECPHCGAKDGYKVVGQVASLDAGKDHEDEEEPATEEEPVEEPETEPEEKGFNAIEDEEGFEEIETEEEIPTDGVLGSRGPAEESLETGTEKPLIEDFDEESFDRLAKRYLNEVYSNVESYKTTDGSIDTSNNKLTLEGVITFKSGKTKKTNFVFEMKDVTKKGKIRFIGMNETFTNSKKAFALVGNVSDKKLLGESLTYNYKVRQGEEDKKIYGRIK